MSCAWAVGGQLLPPTQSGTRAYHERAPNGKFGVILSRYAPEGTYKHAVYHLSQSCASPLAAPRPLRTPHGSLSHDVEAAATRPGGGHEHHHLPVCDI